MEKELNYPIKYAIKEIRTREENMHGYSYFTQGFIVSKCYVLESVVKYNSDGSNSIAHKVVFPYSKFDNFIAAMNLNIPYYEVPVKPIYNEIYSFDYVEKIYDSYEMANVEVFLKNEKLKKDLIQMVSLTDLDWKEKLLQLQSNLVTSLELCKQYENYILENTRDMITNRDTLVIETKKDIEKRILYSRMIDVFHDEIIEEKISNKYDAINLKTKKLDK